MQCVRNYIYVCVCMSKCWKEACLYIYTTVLCIYIYVYYPRPLLSLHTLLPRFSDLSCLWLVTGPYHWAVGFHPHQTIARLFIRAVAGADQTCQPKNVKKKYEVDSINVQRKTKPDESDKD